MYMYLNIYIDIDRHVYVVLTLAAIVSLNVSWRIHRRHTPITTTPTLNTTTTKSHPHTNRAGASLFDVRPVVQLTIKIKDLKWVGN